MTGIALIGSSRIDERNGDLLRTGQIGGVELVVVRDVQGSRASEFGNRSAYTPPAHTHRRANSGTAPLGSIDLSRVVSGQRHIVPFGNNNRRSCGPAD